MKILLTGICGFIGGHFKNFYLRDENLLYGYDIRHGQDITDRLSLYNYFEHNNYDVVIHLAALTSVTRGELFPSEMIKTNIEGTRNVIEMCQRFGVKRLINFSSSSVLGGNPDKHIGLKEDAPYNPISMYGITKTAAELLVKNSGLEYVTIRPFSVYGPNGRQDQVIYRWINQINKKQAITYYGDGQTARGYTHVKDLVNAVIKLATADEKVWQRCKGKTIHLGGETVITLAQLKDIFENYCKRKQIKFEVQTQPISGTDIPYSYADISLAKDLLGFNSTYDFEATVLDILQQELYP